MILSCYVDDDTHRRLVEVAMQTGRTVEDLAECAIAEAALQSERDARPGLIDQGSLKLVV